jgi:hypothetical protein
MSQAPRDAETVPVRVQVIDLQPRVVDVVVPTFLTAGDLTQRIARDAGLGAWWEDGTRRAFWLRARGRVLGPEERLVDVGVVPHELLHLLPEPRLGASVHEREPGWTPDGAVISSRWSRWMRTLMTLIWAGLWCIASVTAPGHSVAWWGAMGLALLLRGAVAGWSPGEVWWLDLVMAVALWPMLAGGALYALGIDAVFGLSWLVTSALGGITGHAIAHLVALGPTDPVDLGGRAEAVAGAAVHDAASCFVCQGSVQEEVLAHCRYGCGRVMHTGCQSACEAAATGPGCEVCGAAVG